MKCVTLAKNLEAKKLEGLQSLATKPAKLFIEEHVAEIERDREHSQLLRNLVGVYSANDFHRLTENIKDKRAALGSNEIIYCPENGGLFSTVLVAYKNRWNLRTSPTDWWFSVVRRIGLALAENASKYTVRQKLGNFKDNQSLQVIVPLPPDSITDIYPGTLFEEVSTKLSKILKLPEFVDVVTADFSETSSIEALVSKITLMTSCQDVLKHEFDHVASGEISAVEMLGSKEDWARLLLKLKLLRSLLKPMVESIGLDTEWWRHVKKVFKKLLATYNGKPDKRWWNRILYSTSAGPGHTNPYNGWLPQFIIGNKSPQGTEHFSTGLVSVPVSLVSQSERVETTGTLAAGAMGFSAHEEGTNGVPSVQPFQGWCLLLHEDSPFFRLPTEEL